ncbi:glycosyltransferase family 2 protein [Candidatus Cetobacterium colombiensis]|uniref:Glycosyltransferase family 2 protein n=1 Tax=Candidatus Cetobacterium colombiensis TaxID=3073100 RepID=A0ABU4W8T6_9FUSO|nr:glycosyltransferase family 2 protein [Candidatus Cetobacterium colombiensis]MDX8335927.1 glycosyltransferase family 2 protein [Candidatus Cetobacterium colombiensis]
MKPLVSVIIPVYNVEKYIEDCLLSIIRSSYKNIEILIIDDCSLDKGETIIKKYLQMDSRVKLLQNEKNKGVCYTRNKGLENASGKYVIFIDGDDFISESWIENLVKIIEEKSCSVVIGKSKNYRDGKIDDYKITDLKTSGYMKFEKMRLSKNGVIWNKIYDLNFLKKNSIFFSKEPLNYGEDLEFVYRVLSKADKIYYSEVGEYFYRCNRPFSLSRKTENEKRIKNLTQVLEKLLSFSKKNDKYNKKTLKKIGEDILIEHFEDPTIKIDMDLIRSVGRFLPEIYMLKKFRKKIKERMGLK